MSKRERDLQKIAEHYMSYLNGPLGKGIMDHLKEGESCTIESKAEKLEITKMSGKAFVKVIERDSPGAIDSMKKFS